MAAATGLDDILVRSLRQCMMTLLPWIQCICNSSLALAYFPKAWCKAHVIALRKPGKIAYDSPQSYRPISLLSNLGKILESLMNRRIMSRLERQQLLAPHQFGFRAGKEVTDACLRLLEDIVAAFRSGMVVQSVMLDIKSAYDTVWKEGLI